MKQWILRLWYIVAMLSLNNVVGVSCLCLRSINICRSQTASSAALVSSMYSASVDDNATVACFFDDHEITLDPS